MHHLCQVQRRPGHVRTAERALRKQLQEQFGVDLTDRKPLIREEASLSS